jgi:hypothetical protein
MSSPPADTGPGVILPTIKNAIWSVDKDQPIFDVNILYGVRPTDPATYVGVSLLVMLVSMLAGFLPARHYGGSDEGPPA